MSSPEVSCNDNVRVEDEDFFYAHSAPLVKSRIVRTQIDHDLSPSLSPSAAAPSLLLTDVELSNRTGPLQQPWIDDGTSLGGNSSSYKYKKIDVADDRRSRERSIDDQISIATILDRDAFSHKVRDKDCKSPRECIRGTMQLRNREMELYSVAKDRDLDRVIRGSHIDSKRYSDDGLSKGRYGDAESDPRPKNGSVCKEHTCSRLDQHDKRDIAELATRGGFAGRGSRGKCGHDFRTAPPLYSLHRATVYSIQPDGIFVRLDGYQDHGLVHHSHVIDHEVTRGNDSEEAKVKALASIVGEREQVWIKVISLKHKDDESTKVGCSMKYVNQDNGRDLDPYNLQPPYRVQGGISSQMLATGSVGRGRAMVQPAWMKHGIGIGGPLALSAAVAVYIDPNEKSDLPDKVTIVQEALSVISKLNEEKQMKKEERRRRKEKRHKFQHKKHHSNRKRHRIC